jgi:hypothetical protein
VISVLTLTSNWNNRGRQLWRIPCLRTLKPVFYSAISNDRFRFSFLPIAPRTIRNERTVTPRIPMTLTRSVGATATR